MFCPDPTLWHKGNWLLVEWRKTCKTNESHSLMSVNLCLFGALFLVEGQNRDPQNSLDCFWFPANPHPNGKLKGKTVGAISCGGVVRLQSVRWPAPAANCPGPPRPRARSPAGASGHDQKSGTPLYYLTCPVAIAKKGHPFCVG